MKKYSVSVWILGGPVNLIVEAKDMATAVKLAMDMSLLEIVGKLKVGDMVTSHSASLITHH